MTLDVSLKWCHWTFDLLVCLLWLCIALLYSLRNAGDVASEESFFMFSSITILNPPHSTKFRKQMELGCLHKNNSVPLISFTEVHDSS
jgi:hypothetical protein